MAAGQNNTPFDTLMAVATNAQLSASQAVPQLMAPEADTVSRAATQDSAVQFASREEFDNFFKDSIKDIQKKSFQLHYKTVMYIMTSMIRETSSAQYMYFKNWVDVYTCYQDYCSKNFAAAIEALLQLPNFGKTTKIPRFGAYGSCTTKAVYMHSCAFLKFFLSHMTPTQDLKEECLNRGADVLKNANESSDVKRNELVKQSKGIFDKLRVTDWESIKIDCSQLTEMKISATMKRKANSPAASSNSPSTIPMCTSSSSSSTRKSARRHTKVARYTPAEDESSKQTKKKKPKRRKILQNSPLRNDVKDSLQKWESLATLMRTVEDMPNKTDELVKKLAKKFIQNTQGMGTPLERLQGFLALKEEFDKRCHNFRNDLSNEAYSIIQRMVEVKKSTIRGAGDGLFAREDIPHGFCLGNPIGEVSRTMNQESKYIFGPDSLDQYLDQANVEESSFHRYLNSMKEEKANLRLQLGKSEKDDIVQNWHLHAKRDIAKGEELFFAYGLN